MGNLFEFYFGLDPASPDTTSAPYALTVESGELRFTYRRGKAQAEYGGQVEWNDSLDTGLPWSTAGVIDEFVSDHGPYEFRRARVPLATGSTKRSLRLKVQSSVP